MEKRPGLKEIREKMAEITHRQPTPEQIKDLGEFFKRVEEKPTSVRDDSSIAEEKKIARAPEKGL